MSREAETVTWPEEAYSSWLWRWFAEQQLERPSSSSLAGYDFWRHPPQDSLLAEDRGISGPHQAGQIPPQCLHTPSTCCTMPPASIPHSWKDLHL